MKDITFKELADLAVTEVADPYSIIENMFQWYFDREMMIVKWLLGAAASVSVALLISYYRHEFNVELWQIIIGIAITIASFLMDFIVYIR